MFRFGKFLELSIPSEVWLVFTCQPLSINKIVYWGEFLWTVAFQNPNKLVCKAIITVEVCCLFRFIRAVEVRNLRLGLVEEQEQILRQRFIDIIKVKPTSIPPIKLAVRSSVGSRTNGLSTMVTIFLT